MICRHAQFNSEVKVIRVGENEYKVDVTVACARCFKPLEFVGLPMGVHPINATKSLDGTEARLNAQLIS